MAGPDDLKPGADYGLRATRSSFAVVGVGASAGGLARWLEHSDHHGEPRAADPALHPAGRAAVQLDPGDIGNDEIKIFSLNAQRIRWDDDGTQLVLLAMRVAPRRLRVTSTRLG
jgi:hypothetical protein